MNNLFFKDKFEVILVSTVFVMVFAMWVIYDFREDVKEFLIAIFGAWLALLRVIQKPSTVKTDYISARNIEEATTQSGDVVVVPSTKTNKKEDEV